MEITKRGEGPALCIAIKGRLDTLSAPELEDELRDGLTGVTDLTFDLEGLDYLSSAGIRVLIGAYRRMTGKGSFKIVNANEMVREVFSLTGVDDYLTIA